MSKNKTCCCPESKARNNIHADTNNPVKRINTGSLNNMVQIPQGTFQMGTNSEVGFADDAEGPVRSIEVNAFYIDKYAVSNQQFAQFVSETSYQTEAEKQHWSFVFWKLLPYDQFLQLYREGKAVKGLEWWIVVEGASWKHPEGPNSKIENRMNHPVCHISHKDAQAFCEWAGKRLPTEAEWEYAARGGLEQKTFPWGDELMPQGEHRCNIWQGDFPKTNTEDDGFLGTAPVDSFPANGYGLYNMSGNTWEWCHDWWTNIHKEKGGTKNPYGPSSNPDQLKVMKGGSFLCHDSYCNRYRLAARTSNTIDSSSSNISFRCVRDI